MDNSNTILTWKSIFIHIINYNNIDLNQLDHYEYKEDIVYRYQLLYDYLLSSFLFFSFYFYKHFIDCSSNFSVKYIYHFFFSPSTKLNSINIIYKISNLFKSTIDKYHFIDLKHMEKTIAQSIQWFFCGKVLNTKEKHPYFDRYVMKMEIRYKDKLYTQGKRKREEEIENDNKRFKQIC